MAKERINFEPYIKEMIYNAQSFHMAAYALRQIAHPDEARALNQPYLLPYHVNEAFAAELYLKVLVQMVKGDVPQTHSLQDLFDELGEFHQTMLFSLADIATRDTDDHFTEQRIRNAIKYSSDAFITFRYFFDSIRKSPKRTFRYYPLHVVIGALIQLIWNKAGWLFNDIPEDYFNIQYKARA